MPPPSTKARMEVHGTQATLEIASGGKSILDLNKIEVVGEFTSGVNTFSLAANIRYDGKKIRITKRLGAGSYGTVYLAEVYEGPKFAIKDQEIDEDAKFGMKTAEALRECDLVSFRAVEVSIDTTGFYLTFMDPLDGDCTPRIMGGLDLTGGSDADGKNRESFVQFMNTLRTCLREHGATYNDMKPGNIGYKRRGNTYQFSLIDLDGINDRIATYPAINRFVGEHEDDYSPNPDERKEEFNLQTDYAFEVTKLIVCLNDPNLDSYLHFRAEKYDKRDKYLEEVMKRTSVSNGPAYAFEAARVALETIRKCKALSYQPPT